MQTRKRTSVLNEADPVELQRSNKRSRRSLRVKEEIDDLRKCGELLDIVRSHRATGNRFLCDVFIRAPSRRTDPEYFKVISQPMDLTRIQQKIRTEEYNSVDEFCADFALLVDNNKMYFKEGSQEYQDACELWELFEIERRRIFESTIEGLKDLSPAPSQRSTRSSRVDEIDSPSTSRSERDSEEIDSSIFEEIIASTLELTDETGRLLSPPFRVLMPPEEFPTYYERIKNPVDLRQMAQKIRSGSYRTWNDFDTDFRRLCRNAKIFNETGSVINKDASALLKHYLKKKAELMQPNPHLLPAEKTEMNRRVIDDLLKQGNTNGYVDAFSEDSEEDEDSETNDDPKWVLYWTIRNEPHPTDPDSNLADPFLELPSRNWYPDYYDEITSPMSLFMINRKLKRGDYGSFDALLSDVLLVFANARSYNIEGSDIHNAAVKLEQLALSKTQFLYPSLSLKSFKAGSLKEDLPNNAERTSAVRTPKLKNVVHTVTSNNTAQNKHRNGLPKSPSTPSAHNLASPRSNRKANAEGRKRFYDHLMLCWNAAHNFMECDRRIVDAFMVLPSKRDYPDYYRVISNPIDMTMVRERIENDKYQSSNDFMSDIKLLFENARTFNEPGSQIVRDAGTLESVIRATYASISDIPLINPAFKPLHNTSFSNSGSSSASSSWNRLSAMNMSSHHHNHHRIASKPSTSEQQKMNDLLTAIKNFRDSRGRYLATAFQLLPSKHDYPDYYDVIRKPIDLSRIGSRLSSDYYETIDGLISDLILMFDNACRYNEPESGIYKDALSLQKIVLQKKRELCKGNSKVLDVQSEVRSILTSLFIAVNNHQDSDGRCYSDSLAEVPSLLKRKGLKPNEFPFSLDEIRKNIDKGRYRRLDRFQDDLFALFHAAREHTRTDSQLFEDTVELQLHYLTTRDDLTRNFLNSPAQYFNERVFRSYLDALRKKKIPEEENEDANNEAQSLGVKAEGDEDIETVEQEGFTYRVHDYAYVAASDGSSRRHIMRIERLYRDSDGQTFARGSWFYRPVETFHLATKKFIENEVFLTSYFDTVTIDRLVGKCCVMFIRKYLKMKPKGFADGDVYVCESKYLGRALHFKKVKLWPHKDDTDNIEYEERSEPLSNLVRVVSAFANEKPPQANDANAADVEDNESQNSFSSSEDDRLKNLPPVLTKERVEIPITNLENYACPEVGEKVPIFFEQMQFNGQWYQVGEFVDTFDPLHKKSSIYRIDRMWRIAPDQGMFAGPYFAKPDEIVHEPTRMFYKRELFAVEQPDSIVPMSHVRNHCAVLLLKDYVNSEYFM
ncbi:hypothetical protein AB6A40_001522 [Gnathostoma spinigerum]|uniref:Protein polybromo-1 n=1 Tax=Gnathostoma spinigerum TaxID=75299 RepID=A0ABD6E4B9_9BILA